MKVALCAIAKQENLYIREWIQHYQKIHVDKIFLYDNNDKDGERIESLLWDVPRSFIEIIDFRGMKTDWYPSVLTIAYHDCLLRAGDQFDWIMFFDIDEFLHLKNYSDIHDFLAQDKFNDFLIIHVNWLLFDDNDLVWYDSRPVLKRFTRYLLDEYENRCTKSIVRRHIPIDKLNWIKAANPHTPYSNSLNVCNMNGEKTSGFPNIAPCYDEGYLKHYQLKTCDEFFNMKLSRWYPDGKIHSNKKEDMIYRFFRLNRFTLDKWNCIKTTYLK